MNLKPYRKLVVAVLGGAILVGAELTGVSQGAAVDAVVALLTAFGVYQAKND